MLRISLFLLVVLNSSITVAETESNVTKPGRHSIKRLSKHVGNRGLGWRGFVQLRHPLDGLQAAAAEHRRELFFRQILNEKSAFPTNPAVWQKWHNDDPKIGKSQLKKASKYGRCKQNRL